MADPRPETRVENGIAVKDGAYTPLGYRTLTAGKTANTAFALASISGGIPDHATKLLVVAVGGNAYWRDDGVDPTETDGMPIFTEVGEWLTSDNLESLRLVAGSGVSLRGSFYA